MNNFRACVLMLMICSVPSLHSGTEPKTTGKGLKRFKNAAEKVMMQQRVSRALKNHINNQNFSQDPQEYPKVEASVEEYSQRHSIPKDMSEKALTAYALKKEMAQYSLHRPGAANESLRPASPFRRASDTDADKFDVTVTHFDSMMVTPAKKAGAEENEGADTGRSGADTPSLFHSPSSRPQSPRTRVNIWVAETRKKVHDPVNALKAKQRQQGIEKGNQKVGEEYGVDLSDEAMKAQLKKMFPADFKPDYLKD